MIQDILLKLCEFEFERDLYLTMMNPKYSSPSPNSFTYLAYCLYG